MISKFWRLEVQNLGVVELDLSEGSEENLFHACLLTSGLLRHSLAYKCITVVL